MRMPTTIRIAIICFLPFILVGQSSEYRHKSYSNQQIKLSTALQEMCESLKIEKTSLKEMNTHQSSNGYRHKKYYQTYDGLEVYGTRYIIHTKGDQIVSSNGYLAADININTTPEISKNRAITIAKQKLPSKKYFEDRVEPVELMIIDKAFPEVSESYSLVYKVELYSSDPVEKRLFFIDATSGQLILDLPGLAHESTPATAHTKYHGEVEIITESTPQGDYILQDLTRGDGITTFNYSMTLFSNTTTTWDLTNSNKDEVALDAHYCTEKFYDMMLHRFGWDGLDGDGLSMNPVVHAFEGDDLVNAYWDGENAWFGNGDCHRGPLTTMEVVGHEFMHGITDYTSDLIYFSESGAINESMSDIFGKGLEYYFAPDEFDWAIGESFLLSDVYEPFRYMDDPNRLEMPAYYDGIFWSSSADVHTNSAIGNLWFYILVEGKSDVTEMDESYDVSGIGMDKALEIVWQVQSNYLFPNSDYHDMMMSTIDVATAIYGEESPELSDVIEAWKAVGSPSSTNSTTLEYDYDLQLEIGALPNRLCLYNESYPLTFKIINVGLNNIYSDSDIVLSYFHNSPNAFNINDFIIDEDILIGDTLILVYEDLFFLDAPGENTISATINYNKDYNYINDKIYLQLENLNPIYNTLKTSTNQNPSSCFAESNQFTLNIKNLSCTKLLAGSIITYYFVDIYDQVIRSESIPLEDGLEPGGYIQIPEQVSEEYEVFKSYAETQLNPDPLIDFNYLSFEKNKEISGQYLNNLTNLTTNENELDIIDIDQLYNYNGKLYLANSAGWLDESIIACPDPKDNFQYSYYYDNGYAKISSCIDVSTLTNPVLSFDLVQFRNDDSDISELVDIRCSVKVSWGDNDYLIINDQEEGIEKSISIPLPNNYVGEFSIEFINLTGVSTFSALFLEFDVNLIRNLEIKSSTSTQDPELESTISISPNPGMGLYYIESPYNIEKIEIIDTKGELVYSESNVDYNTIDIQDLASGYYIVSISLTDGRQISKPLVNVNR